MEAFDNFQHRRGLTFATRAGAVCYWQTLRQNNVPRFLRDVRELSVTEFDLVVTDFEPVTAWAGHRAGIPTIGIGHQYAFGPDTPIDGDHWLARQIMHRFAPVERAVGLHWHPYDSSILPPIIDLPEPDGELGDHVLVYLPFEDASAVRALLQQFPEFRFCLYGPGLDSGEHGNVKQHPASVAAFKRDLSTCSGVICNTGFELISECLHWQKPVLTKPLAGQTEQLANALALRQLGYATVTAQLDHASLAAWLRERPSSSGLRLPDVAGTLASWLATGARTEIATLQQRLWLDTWAGSTAAPLRPSSKPAAAADGPQQAQVLLGNLASIR
jgi:uncharacterized protein (TIGR00661 family)